MKQRGKPEYSSQGKDQEIIEYSHQAVKIQLFDNYAYLSAKCNNGVNP